MNQNVLKFFRNFRVQASSVSLPQHNEIGKVINLNPFSIYPENFKSISLIFIENLRAQKGSKKVRKWTGTRNRK